MVWLEKVWSCDFEVKVNALWNDQTYRAGHHDGSVSHPMSRKTRCLPGNHSELSFLYTLLFSTIDMGTDGKTNRILRDPITQYFFSDSYRFLTVKSLGYNLLSDVNGFNSPRTLLIASPTYMSLPSSAHTCCCWQDTCTYAQRHAGL